MFDMFVFRIIPWAKPHRHTQSQCSEASRWASWRLENMETYGWCNKHKRATRDVGWVCRRLWTGYILVRNGSDTGSAGAVIQLQRLDNKTRKGRLLTPQPTIRCNNKIQEKRKREMQALIDLTGISAALGDWIFSAGVWPIARPPVEDHRTFDCSTARKTSTAGFSLIYSLFVPVSFGGSFTPTVASECVMRPREAKTSRTYANTERCKQALRHFNLLFLLFQRSGRRCWWGRRAVKWVNKHDHSEYLMSCVSDESERSHLKSEKKSTCVSVYVELAAH